MNYNKNIFTSNELKIIRGVDGNSFQKRLSYNLKTNKFIKIRKGIYAIADSINFLEDKDMFQIANSIYTPSYISLETVLTREGINFQYYGDIKLMSPYAKEIQIDTIPDHQLLLGFVRLPKELLTNNIGLVQKDGYVIATKERAICDTLWRWCDYYFDSLSHVDRDLLLDIAREYKNYNIKVYETVLSLKSLQDAKK